MASADRDKKETDKEGAKDSSKKEKPKAKTKEKDSGKKKKKKKGPSVDKAEVDQAYQETLRSLEQGAASRSRQRRRRRKRTNLQRNAKKILRRKQNRHAFCA